MEVMIFCYKHTDKQTLHHYIYIITIIIIIAIIIVIHHHQLHHVIIMIKILERYFSLFSYS